MEFLGNQHSIPHGKPCYTFKLEKMENGRQWKEASWDNIQFQNHMRNYFREYQHCNWIMFLLRTKKEKMNMLSMQQNWEASSALIGVEGKHKKRLISSSFLHSCDGINTTTSEAHNEVVNPCIC